jgi:hypothetical protein
MKAEGQGPKKLGGPGTALVGISGRDPSKVLLQWYDPEWWVEFTPAEARHLALLMLKKADECEAMLRAKGGN